MIVRDHLPLRRVWPAVAHRLVLLFLFDLAIASLYTFAGWKSLALSGLPLSTMGSAIGIFLAFRTNSAYERWWEARVLWGGLVNASRTLARQVLTLIDRETDDPEPSPLQRRLMNLQIAFITSVRCHLRRQNALPELRSILGQSAAEDLREHRNIPSALLLQKATVLQKAKEDGLLSDFRWVQIDGTLTEMTSLIGSCERIKATPLPRQYDFFPRVLVNVYCLLLPFGLVEGMGLLTPLASTLVSFIFIALDTVGRDIEAPFENTVHDTPLTAISRTIEINLRQLFGDRNIPPEIKPVDGFLY
jgi:putative membrane protein